ncbi:MAG: hypothetical protein AAB955_01300 [Patescibacteria group bacterium]
MNFNDLNEGQRRALIPVIGGGAFLALDLVTLATGKNILGFSWLLNDEMPNVADIALAGIVMAVGIYLFFKRSN